MTTIPTTAADVRNYFRTNEAALTALSAEAQATVRKGARGRLHPEAREAFNANVKPSKRYAEGTPKTVPLSYKHVQPSGRKVTKTVALPESKIRALAAAAGVPVGKRGPLSKAAMVAAGENYAKA
jgi:hypothetical protein